MRNTTPNRIDDLANTLYRQGRIQDLELELQKFDLPGMNPAEREAWYHLRGILAARRGDHAMALNLFEQGLEAFPASHAIKFSLGRQYEHFGLIAEMFELFDEIEFPDDAADYALTRARYAYLWDQYDRGLRYLAPIFDAYFALKNVDETFLYMRGLPFFWQTWSYYAAFCFLKDDLAPAQDLLNQAQLILQDYDFRREIRFLDCLKKRDFQPFLALTPIPDRGSAYWRIQSSLLVDYFGNDWERMEARLSRIPMRKLDFPWLEDMKLLARCAMARHRGDEIGEIALRQTFREKQPLLFEPDHALHFGMLEYQERLKAFYQREKIKNQDLL